MSVDIESLVLDKRLVRVKLWFITPDFKSIQIKWNEGEPFPELPEDGFLCGKGLLADGCSENYGGDGWLVVGMTLYGLLCQTTGGDRPDSKRYPNFQFSRCRLAPSAIMHAASAEMQEATWP